MSFLVTTKYPPFLTAFGTGDTLEEALGMLGDVIDGLIRENETRPMPPDMQAEYATAKMLGQVGGTLTLEVYKKPTFTGTEKP